MGDDSLESPSDGGCGRPIYTETDMHAIAQDIKALVRSVDFGCDFEYTVTGSGWDGAGNFIETKSESIQLRGAVQPASPEDTEYLPEGDKYKPAIMVYIDTELSTVEFKDPSRGDIISWHGKHYRVASASDWSYYGLWEVMAVREYKNE